MLSKNKIKFVRSLQLPKYRQKYQKITVEGFKIVEEVLTEELVPVSEVFTTTENVAHFKKLIRDQRAIVTEADIRDLKRMSALKTPQDVLALCEIPKMAVDMNLAAQHMCLYLDGIRNPGNLGTIFRIADWFGFPYVFISRDTVDPYNPKVLQASMGSLFRVQWAETEIDVLTRQYGMQTYVTALGGIPVSDLPPVSHGLLVFGNESVGARRSILDKADFRLTITDNFRLGADSLNVAVAAGIVCAQFRFNQMSQHDAG